MKLFLKKHMQQLDKGVQISDHLPRERRREAKEKVMYTKESYASKNIVAHNEEEGGNYK